MLSTLRPIVKPLIALIAREPIVDRQLLGRMLQIHMLSQPEMRLQAVLLEELRARKASIAHIATERSVVGRDVGLDFSAAEGLPTSVCRECSTYVWDFNLYSAMVERNQNVLLTMRSEKHETGGSNQQETVLNPDSDDDPPDEQTVNPEAATDQNEEDFQINQVLEDRKDCEEHRTTLSDDSDVEEVVRENAVISLDNDESSGEETEPAQERRTYSTRSGQLPQNGKLGRSYRCGTCAKSFELKRELKHHTQMKHTSNGASLRCDQCEKSFRTTMQLRDHQRLHKREQCPKCGKMVVSRNIKVHIAAHDGAFRCDVCDRCFSCSQFLKQHRKQAHMPAGASKTEQCDQCGQAFYTKYQLAIHQRGHEKVVCKICKKTVTKRRIKEHLAGHRGAFRCDVCGVALLTRCSLRQHTELKHHSTELPPDERFTCDQCDERFYNATQLKHHRYLKHAVRQCAICKQIVRSAAFVAHAATHQRIQVPCDVCGKNYSSRKNLTRHKEIMHPRIDPTASKPAYPCHHCEKTFHNHTQLSTHLYRVEKVACPVCRQIVARSLFAGHMTKHRNFYKWREEQPPDSLLSDCHE
uniref:C2H2-type domain-containing protein n=1 Tax=Anopheles dirus TaxID=7168 RepID=A0A182NTG3_9DIPT